MNCIFRPYEITLFKYQSSSDGKTIEKRKEKFRIACRKALIELGWDNEKDFPRRLKDQWVDKWEAINISGHKMAFEKEKTFDIKARIRTFRRNDQQWNPKLWQKDKKLSYQPVKTKGNYSPIDYEAKRSNKDQEIGEILGAGERLKNKFKM